MNNSKIWLSSPHLGQNERQYVNEAFDLNWISPVGPHLPRFEEAITQVCKVSHSAALSSGTAALHLGLRLLGVGPGDYVICQSFTFCGSANPITYLGAHPVFVDSEEDTWNMDPDFLAQALEELSAKGQKPKAIIPVHLYGMPAKMNEIREVAHRYGVPVLEDAAEALGSTYHNKPCGSLGDLSVLSFNGNKMITTSGGGALLGNVEEKIQKAKFLATQARDPAPHYQHSEIGYNYRLSNVSAAIGLGQMEVLTERVNQRQVNFQRYQDYFEAKIKSGYHIRFQPQPEGSISNRWLSCIVADPEKNKGITRETIRLALEQDNIESRPLWKPMHLQPVFKDAPYFGGAVAENLFEKGLCLPSGSNLTEENFDRIFAKLDQIFK